MNKRSAIVTSSSLFSSAFAGWILALSCLFGSLPLVAARPESSGPPVSPDRVIDSLFALRTFRQAAISPDGTKVGWVESLDGANGQPSGNSAIYVVDRNHDRVARRVRASKQHSAKEKNLAWSPDSKRLAFLSDAAAPGQSELYVVDALGGTPRKLTSLIGFLDDPQWSSDGKTIAILFTENAPRSAGPLEPMTPDAGVVEAHIYEQRITTVDVASGATRLVSPADLYVYEYDWSPDSRAFAATAAHGAGDNNWWIAQLFTVALDTGAAKSILRPALQIALPRWSPDGKNIAYIGGLMSDEGSTGGDIFIVPATGGTPTNVTPGIKASVQWLGWSTPGKILFLANVAGMSSIDALSIEKPYPQVETLWKGAEQLSNSGAAGLTVSRHARVFAMIRSSFELPPEIWSGETGSWTQVSHSNDRIRPHWGEGKNITWTSDGQSLQGWLLYPENFTEGQLYPMVVEVHGGPSAACESHWPRSMTALLPSQGYFVFCPNPRGSFGQGEAFTQANVKDFGYGDLRDILRGTDTVVKNFPVDPQRLGMAGWSYGGYMTMWTVTQSTRFRAAVAGAGIANWQSYYGLNDIDQWMIPFFGASVYDDPEVYARSSPITFIKKVKTPTLVLAGDRDGEVPAPQSYEFWHALKTLGVPTQLVVYLGEGHHISQPEHRRDVWKKTLEWFNRYLSPADSASR